MVRAKRKQDGKLFAESAISVCLFDDGYYACLFGRYIPINVPYRPLRKGEIMESWGFSFSAESKTFHLSWGGFYKVYELPWSWHFIKHEVRRPDGSWVPYVADYEDKDPDGREVWVFDYTYVLKNGTKQLRKATVYVERREWRWKWLRWFPYPRLVSQVIDVHFDAEVGERTGSWKGGTIGCGYEMEPGETAEQTLRRMERERRFN